MTRCSLFVPLSYVPLTAGDLLGGTLASGVSHITVRFKWGQKDSGRPKMRLP